MLLLLPVEEQYLNNRNTTKHENFQLNFFSWYVQSHYIFGNLFTSCVTDCYRHKQCIIMENKLKTNMKILYVYRFIGCVQHVIFSLSALLPVLLVTIR